MYVQLLYPGASANDGTGTVLRDAAFFLNNNFTRLAGDSWRQPVIGLRASPPLAPVHGARYRIGPTGDGAFAGRVGQIAEWVGTPPNSAAVNAWHFETPAAGAVLFEIEGNGFLRWDGAAWVSLLAGGTVDWSAIANRPASFPPSAHGHAWGDVTGVPALVGQLAGLSGDGLLSKTGSTLSLLTGTAFGTGLLSLANAAALRTLIDAPQAADVLLRGNNLSDLASPAAARANLGLGAAATLGTSGPGQVVVRDAGGKIPVGDLPALAITSVFEAGSEAAMLALTAEAGDLCLRTDTGERFVLAASPASTLSNWKLLTAPSTGAVSSVFGQTGTVTVPGLTSTADAQDADELPVFDASANAHRRMTRGTLLTGVLRDSNLATSTPSALGTAAPGTATSPARADHVHAHGDQAGGTLHAVATPTLPGFMSAADKAKLDAIPTGGAGVTSIQRSPGIWFSNQPVNSPGNASGVPQSGAVTLGFSPHDLEEVNTVNPSSNYLVIGETSIGSARKITPNDFFSRLSPASHNNGDLRVIITRNGSLMNMIPEDLLKNRLLWQGRFAEVREACGSVDVNGNYVLPTVPLLNLNKMRLIGNSNIILPSISVASNGFSFSMILIIDQDPVGDRTLSLTASAGETIIPSEGQGAPGNTISNVAIATGAGKRTRIVLSCNSGEARWDMAIVYKEA